MAFARFLCDMERCDAYRAPSTCVAVRCWHVRIKVTTIRATDARSRHAALPFLVPAIPNVAVTHVPPLADERSRGASPTAMLIAVDLVMLIVVGEVGYKSQSCSWMP